MKILNILASNKYSGAENVVCQIADILDGEIESLYASPNGPIEESLKDKKVKFFPLEKFNVKNVKKLIKQVQPDVIHAHDVKASFVASRAKGKLPLVCHLHGNDFKTRKFSLKSLLFHYATTKAKSTIFVSSSCFDDYFFKNKVKNPVVIPNVISTKALLKKVSQDNFDYDYDIAYVGRLSDPKNPLRMLEILRLVIKENPKIKCAVVGDGTYMQDCKNFVASNKLQSNIELLGFKNNPYKILKTAKVSIMSSLYEGTPMSALESLALGTPIVSTPTDGLRAIIKSGVNGFLYSTDEDAKKYILEILSEPNKYEQQTLEYFSSINNTQKFKQELMHIYNSATAKK